MFIKKYVTPQVQMVGRVQLPNANGGYYYYLIPPNADQNNLQDSSRLHVNPSGPVKPSTAVLSYVNQPPSALQVALNNPSAVAGVLDEAVSVAGYMPVAGYAYAGQDIVRSAQSTYYKNQDASTRERVKKTAEVVADKTIYHLIGTIFLPLFISHQILSPPVEKLIALIPDKSRFAKMKTYHHFVKFSVFMLAAIMLHTPIDWVTDKILEYAYRPLLDKKKREDLKNQFYRMG
jgi:hypothetical protein